MAGLDACIEETMKRKTTKAAAPELLWASRVTTPLDPVALAFSSSIAIDKRLYREDIVGSIAHAASLAASGIITARDAARITRGLKTIEREIREGTFTFRTEQEDIHTAIEQRLTVLIGAAAGKLHAGRSRNDQVAVDERLFLRSAIAALRLLIRATQEALLRQADRYRDLIIPGYTHLQHAQPVLAAHYLLAWMEMLERDSTRLEDCAKRMDVSPLGAAAFAGTPLPIDTARTARALDFAGPFANSIDAVSDRDHIVEFTAACATLMMHISRFAEDLVVWSTAEFGIVDCGDAFTTGSSIMPHKRNPDIAELLRGRTGRAYGALMSILTVMKGVPLTYSRDMQEDKQPMFDAYDTAQESLSVFVRLVRAMSFNAERAEILLEKNYITATEIADYLVGRGVAFRQAHRITGAIVAHVAARGIPLRALSLKEFKNFSPKFDAAIFSVLDPRSSVQRKRSAGSTAPQEVQAQITRWKKKLR